MYKYICQIILSCFLVFSVFSQQNLKQYEEREMPEEIKRILIEAATLQPELTIDIYLNAVSSDKIKSISKKKELLEEAFYLSFQTKEKTPRNIIAFEGQVLTIRPTFISNAHRYKLSTLSLQTRIITEMLKVDKARAFELFNEISPDLSLKPLTCQDVLLYEVSDFYELLGKFAESKFTPEQIRQGQRIAFLSTYIERMNSPSQISPVVKMLVSSKLTDDELLNLAGTFSKSLRKISGDDRAFSYQMNFASTGRDIYEFSRKLFFTTALYDELRASYKDYLTKNMQGKRCRDNVEFEKRTGKIVSENEMPEIKLPLYVFEANQAFYRELPITNEEINSSEIESFSFPSEYLRFGKAGQIYGQVRKLRDWDEAGLPIAETKDSMERQEVFSRLLETIEDWKKSDKEDEIDLFHQKSLVYRLLFKEAPFVALKEQVVKKYLKLLNQNEIQREFVLQWFLEFNGLLTEIRELKLEEREKLLGVMGNSNNTAVSLYLDLEKKLKAEKNNSVTKTVTPSN